jgi:uncharacterized protein with GYD domain
MMTFVMLTRLAPGGMRSPRELEALEREVMNRVRSECPETEWLHSFAVLGPYDYVDVFQVPTIEIATKVSTIVRTYGHATTELWPALAWGHFKDVVRTLRAPGSWTDQPFPLPP